MNSGDRIGPYEIENELGAGGMAQVFRAKDTRLNRLVAMKRLTKKAIPMGEGRFAREAQLASGLNHTNIVTIHDVIDDGSDHWIVMELIDGHTLRELRLELKMVLRVIGQVAEALVVAHQAGIVHRDIKPENIMMRADGVTKVLDFGLAKPLPEADLEEPSDAETKTDALTVMGTPRYMSPEQVAAEKRLRTSSDIFSLGIVLYELATGQYPFNTSSRSALWRSILSEDPKRPSTLNSQIGPKLDSLIRRMLEKDPSSRPDARTVVAELSVLELDPAAGTRAQARLQSHWVGRQEELNGLHEGFYRATQNRGLLMCVSGEPGIGKTTLVEDFLSQLEFVNIGRGRCSQRLAGTEPYLPLVDALGDLLRSEDGNVVARVMKKEAPEWYRLVDPAGAEAAPGSEMREPLPARMRRELLALLRALSSMKPLVLFLDDLQWADGSTLDAVSYLSNHYKSLKILTIVTHRSGLNAAHPVMALASELKSRGECEVVKLGFLKLEHIREYLSLEFPDHQFPPEFLDFIHRRTDGNPLFMVDLLRHLQVVKKSIVKKDGAWVLLEKVAALELDLKIRLSEGIAAMIGLKIDGLKPETRQLLLVAAVQGHEFDSELIAQVLKRKQASVEKQLNDLHHTHGLVQPLKVVAMRTTQRYSFVHVFYQDVLYREYLSASEKAEYSRKVARILLARHGEDIEPIASALSLLFQDSGNFDKAAHYSFTAAENASKKFAHKEAVLLAQRGLDQLRQLAGGRERDQRELRTLLLLGNSLMATEGFGGDEVGKTYTRTRDLAKKLQDFEQELVALRGLWAFHIVRADSEEAKQYSNMLVERAVREGNDSLLVEAHHALGFTLGHEGMLEEAVSHHDTALVLYDRLAAKTNYRYLFALNPSVGCRVEMAMDHWILGRPDTALLWALDGLTRAEELKQPYTLAFAYMFAAVIRELRREPAEVKSLAKKAIQLAEEYGLQEVFGWSHMRYGWALAAEGHREEGISIMQKMLERQKKRHSLVALPHFLASLADALIWAGRINEAVRYVKEGLDTAENTNAHYYDAELIRLENDCIVLNDSNFTLAEKGYLKAIDCARRQNALAWELRASMSLARLLTMIGRKEEGKARLEDVRSRFDEGAGTEDLKDADRLLIS